MGKGRVREEQDARVVNGAQQSLIAAQARKREGWARTAAKNCQNKAYSFSAIPLFLPRYERARRAPSSLAEQSGCRCDDRTLLFPRNIVARGADSRSSDERRNLARRGRQRDARGRAHVSRRWAARRGAICA